ncbi:MAG: hypothetical protein ACO3DH_03955, partial [Candidatus Kapaibacteriota bacterium]
MRKGFLVGLAATSALALPISNVEAQVPRFITFQGVLLDANNKPVADGSYDIRVHVYEQAAGGAALYTENALAVTSDGAFSIVLGSNNSLPPAVDFKAGYWAAVQVGNNPEMPRMKMTTTGYAFASDYAYNAANAANAANATFATTAGTAAPSGPAGGDLAGTYPNPEIKAGAVGAAEIADGSIEQRHFSANLTFPPTGPAGGDLTAFYPNPKIAVGAVKTVHIGDVQVIEQKLATGAVSSRTILDGGIATVDIADGAVTTAKIADGTVAPVDLNTGSTTADANELLMATGSNSQEWLNAPTAVHQSLHWDGSSVSWRKLTPSTLATETNAAANTTSGVGLNRLLMGTGADNGDGGTQGWLNAPTSNRNVLRYNLASNSLQWSPNNALDFPIDETVNLTGTMFNLTNQGTGTTGQFNNSSSGTALSASNSGTGTALNAQSNTGVALNVTSTGLNTATTAQITHVSTSGSALSVNTSNNPLFNSNATAITVNNPAFGYSIDVNSNPSNPTTQNNAGVRITQTGRGEGIVVSKTRGNADNATAGIAVSMAAGSAGNGISVNSGSSASAVTVASTGTGAALTVTQGNTSLQALTAGATTLGATTATSINSTPVGNTTPSTGAFTTLSSTGATALGATTATSINSTPVGNTTPSTGAFTTLSSTGATTLGATTAASINNTPVGNT